MSRIRGAGTKIELLVRKELHARGFRYRLGGSGLPGRPDLYLPKYRTVVFVHGCFWHGHVGCPYFVVPKTRTEWWLSKIRSNQERDQRNIEELSRSSLRVLIVFECQLRPTERLQTLASLFKTLKRS